MIIVVSFPAHFNVSKFISIVTPSYHGENLDSFTLIRNFQVGLVF